MLIIVWAGKVLCEESVARCFPVEIHLQGVLELVDELLQHCVDFTAVLAEHWKVIACQTSKSCLHFSKCTMSFKLYSAWRTKREVCGKTGNSSVSKAWIMSSGSIGRRSVTFRTSTASSSGLFAPLAGDLIFLLSAETAPHSWKFSQIVWAGVQFR